MEVEMQEVVLPERTQIKIDFSLTSEVNITDVSAQRKVSRLLLERVGNLLYGERPNLVFGRRLLWRVPIWLGLPSVGPVGQLGSMDVDAQTGEILFTQQLLNTISDQGNELARRTLSSAT